MSGLDTTVSDRRSDKYVALPVGGKSSNYRGQFAASECGSGFGLWVIFTGCFLVGFPKREGDYTKERRKKTEKKEGGGGLPLFESGSLLFEPTTLASRVTAAPWKTTSLPNGSSLLTNEFTNESRAAYFFRL